MIKRVTLRDFRCLREVDVRLDPFTVLVGKNDSGKTCFLDALFYLSRLASVPVAGERGSPFNGPYAVKHQCTVGVAKKELAFAIECAVKGLSDSVRYEVAVAQDGGTQYISKERLEIDSATIYSQDQDFKVTDHTGNVLRSAGSPRVATMLYEMRVRERDFPEVAAFRRYLASGKRYELDTNALKNPCPIPESDALSGEPLLPSLRPDGGDLPLVIEYLQRQDFKDRRFTALLGEICRLLPAIRFVEAVPWSVRGYTDAGDEISKPGLVLRFRLKGSEEYVVAPMMSDGAMRLMGYLALARSPRYPGHMLVEEPETGIHVGLLHEVAKLFEDLCSPDRSDPLQIIVTTHSPYMLDFVKPSQVRIFHRKEGDATTVTPMEETAGYKKYGAAYLTGELWGNVLEEGLLAPPTPETSPSGDSR